METLLKKCELAVKRLFKPAPNHHAVIRLGNDEKLYLVDDKGKAEQVVMASELDPRCFLNYREEEATPELDQEAETDQDPGAEEGNEETGTGHTSEPSLVNSGQVVVGPKEPKAPVETTGGETEAPDSTETPDSTEENPQADTKNGW